MTGFLVQQLFVPFPLLPGIPPTLPQYVVELALRSRFKTQIRNVAQLQQCKWHLRSKQLLTLYYWPAAWFQRNLRIHLRTVTEPNQESGRQGRRVQLRLF